MDKIKIETRRDYELFVKNEVSKRGINISNKIKSLIREIAMESFDNGTNFAKGQLYIDIKDIHDNR